MKFKLFLSSYLIISCLVNFNAQQYSLNEAIEYAMENSNAVRMQQLEIEDANYQIQEYKAFGMPQLTGGINYSYYFKQPSQPTEDFLSPAVYGILFQEGVLESRELGPPDIFEFSFFRKNQLSGFLEFNALLFDGSFLQGLKAAKLFRELTASQMKLTRKTIKENVTKAYLAVLVAERNIKIIEQNLDNVTRSLEETQAYYDQGFAEQLDVDRLQLSLENLTREHQKLEKLIELSYNILKYQMNYPLQESLKVTENLENAIDSMMIDEIGNEPVVDYNQRPEYEILNRAIALDEVDLKRLRNGYLPTLKAFVNASESLQRDNLFDGSEPGLLPDVSAGIGITVPIFDGREKNAQIQRTKIRLAKREIEKEEFERSMHLEVLNAKIQLLNSQKSLESSQKSLELNQDIFNKAQIKFREGVGSSVELKQAESSLYSAQSVYISSLYDLILAKTDLDIALGKLK